MDVTLADGRQLNCDDVPFAFGAEGELYLTDDGKRVVKLYGKAGPDKERHLELITGRYNVVRGEGAWETSFAWPQALVKSPQLGVLMQRAPEDLAPIVNFVTLKFARRMTNQSARGTWEGHVRVAAGLARSVRRLHTSGLCHSDLSWNNVLMSPQRGQCMLLDCDGLVVPQFLPPSVLGTPKCMAPEIMAGREGPSIQADLHALAVILYRLLLFRHPLEGPMRHGGDPMEEDYWAYGPRALFIEHPSDRRNRPERFGFPIEQLGDRLKHLFLRAFVDGLHSPALRPQADEWEEALTKALALVIPCTNPDCEFKAYLAHQPAAACPWCGTGAPASGRFALKLYDPVTGKPGQYHPQPSEIWYGGPGKRLYRWNFELNSIEFGADTGVIATVLNEGERWYLQPQAGVPLRVFGKGALQSGIPAPVAPGERIMLGAPGSSRIAEVHFIR